MDTMSDQVYAAIAMLALCVVWVVCWIGEKL